MSDAIHVVATLVAAEGKAEELQEALLSMLAPSRAEEGCVSYDLFRDRKNPDQFVFVEQWRDEEAIKEHGQAPHMTEAGAKLGGLLGGRPSIVRLAKVG